MIALEFLHKIKMKEWQHWDPRELEFAIVTVVADLVAKVEALEKRMFKMDEGEK